jgi:adenylate cyclase
MMAIFGLRGDAASACRAALAAARAAQERVNDMNRALAEELPQPIRIGTGIHAGNAIVGDIGFRDLRISTAIGDTVHVASRLQELTKDYRCQLVISQAVADGAGIDVGGFPSHDVQVRGREAKLRINVIEDVSRLDGTARRVT